MKPNKTVQMSVNEIFVPRHHAGVSQIENCIDRAISMAREAGITVDGGVARKWAPAYNMRNDGGPEFVSWLAGQGLELCKSDKSGAWWTVVKLSDITKRDRMGTAIQATNKFASI